jgi:hypothetical protein
VVTLNQVVIHFSVEMEKRIMNRYRFCPSYQIITSVVKTVQFVSDMMYIMLRDRRCKIIVLNVNGPSEDKTDVTKEHECEELQRVSVKVLKSTQQFC